MSNNISKMKILPRNTGQTCYHHYCRQAGLGHSTVFEGSKFQRGAGLLSTFRRTAIPFITPFLKNAALSAGRYLLRRGNEFLTDIEGGAGVKQAAKQKFGQIKSDVIGGITGRQSGSGGRRMRKRKRISLNAPFPHRVRQKGGSSKRRRVTRTVKRKKKTSKRKQADIFD